MSRNICAYIEQKPSNKDGRGPPGWKADGES
uniref:Uncharacterized protein n=1 Tax=Arundo donax TaxID=35708 RepID=A0A0A9A784_ARUDO